MRDEARSKNLKSGETFAKGCKSLASCPITYPRPRDLVCLRGIGPKIVSVLEKRWKVHCEENGLALPGTPQRKHRAPTPPSDISIEESIPPPSQDPQPSKKARKPVKPKVYVPQPGSGGYGILLALILAIDDPRRSTQVFLTKGEVMNAAQEYCDSSYERSDKGTHFTAWSSMKTLVNKGYVYVTGNPHKYCLTEEGYEVALAVRNLRPEFSHMEKHPFLHSPARVGSLSKAPTSHKPPDSASASGPSIVHKEKIVPRKSSEKFEFWYIDAFESRVHDMSEALLRLDPDEFVNIRKIEFRFHQRDHPFTAQLRIVDTTARVRHGTEATLYGYIIEDTAPPRCSTFSLLGDAPGAKDISPPRLGDITVTFNDDFAGISDDEDFLPIMDNSTVIDRTTSLVTTPPKSSSLLATGVAVHRNTISVQSQTTSSLNSTQSTQVYRPAPRLSSHMPAPTAIPDSSEKPTNPVPAFTPADAITFPAGSYDIVLILDTREVESKTRRDEFAEALIKKGINVEQRALRLGDMLWIARRRDGWGGEADECVLDYVVERKRLDDLCSSIKDGRYTEQCFRLGNSAISQVFYIVEDYNVAERMAYDGPAILTAKSQLQVHAGFFLKETHRLSETIDFLVTMTNLLTSMLSQQDLKILPTKYISRSSYTTFQDYLRKTYPRQKYLTSFEAYQSLNDKSASRTLREQWGRMLLCIKGISAERVSAVLDEYDTPVALWRAMKQAREVGDEIRYTGVDDGVGKGAQEVVVDDVINGKGKKRKREVEGFFAERIKGEGRRKIGEALSVVMWNGLMGNEG
ncbi:hypothetical protein M231_01716 [Tremella mesenterica]|uniref:Crossover junction endonuclease MUS81 n=1 Tax=Tremella mesenterica TaxID=5217 RepID=A0A4Q1BSR2_TREME|nr:hypothetical protein M231_01716 [Tremella mesenterica]